MERAGGKSPRGMPPGRASARARRSSWAIIGRGGRARPRHPPSRRRLPALGRAGGSLSGHCLSPG
eukprot:7522669-Lingulodinium_polyedra.AAC.1